MILKWLLHVKALLQMKLLLLWELSLLWLIGINRTLCYPIQFVFMLVIRNSNWTEWSTIQEVIAWVISKSDEREARGRFETTSTITPWIVRHEVQLLINRIYNKISELKMSSKNFFWAKTSVALFLSFENCRKHC